MNPLDSLSTYRAINSQDVLSLLNSRPRVIPFQNTGTPTAPGASEAAVVTIGDYPWICNSLELGSITASGINGLPGSLFLQFNIYDADNLGFFGGPTAPRASTVFGYSVQIPRVQNPVKVFPPRTRVRIEWTNQGATEALGFELFLNGIEVLGMGNAYKDDGDMRELLEELLYEKRVR